MITKEQLEIYLEKCLQTGADFAEIFFEDSKCQNIKLIDKSVQNVVTKLVRGIGIRICLEEKVVYGYTNKFENINDLIDSLIKTFSGENQNKKIKLGKKKIYKDKVKIAHDEFKIEDKKKLLHNIDKLARAESSKINQVQAVIHEEDQKVVIANSRGTYSEDNRILTRLIGYIFAKDGDKVESGSFAPGFKMGYEFLEDIDLNELIKNAVNNALLMLSAEECPSGQMPVIVGNGFGGVIFHEACGHALEATEVARGTSIFNDLLGKKIANSKVNLVDDATVFNSWGSFNIDDEGLEGKKNILIKNGVLTNYLIDYINGKMMNSDSTSSGRRESYKYAPTSRMSNTFLMPGTDKIDDMIASIDYGVYAKEMGGGTVNPLTGDFNFSVNTAFLIEHGKITVPVRGASLIGNGADIIMHVSMVSDDLKLAPGICGSVSGYVPVTVGTPTIKVDKILVGGKGEKFNV